MQYQGHHSDGGGIQNHSVGPLYPYVVGVRERQIDGQLIRSWILLGGAIQGELSFRTEQEATEAANTLLSERRSVPVMRGQSALEKRMAASFDSINARNQREWSRFTEQRNSIK